MGNYDDSSLDINLDGEIMIVKNPKENKTKVSLQKILQELQNSQNIGSVSFKIVNILPDQPAEGDENKIHLIPRIEPFKSIHVDLNEGNGYAQEFEDTYINPDDIKTLRIGGKFISDFDVFDEGDGEYDIVIGSLNLKIIVTPEIVEFRTEEVALSTDIEFYFTAPEENNIYSEYIYTGNSWELIGQTKIEVDLSNYVSFNDVCGTDKPGILSAKQFSEVFRSKISYIGSADYSTDKITIPYSYQESGLEKITQQNLELKESTVDSAGVMSAKDKAKLEGIHNITIITPEIDAENEFDLFRGGNLNSSTTGRSEIFIDGLAFTEFFINNSLSIDEFMEIIDERNIKFDVNLLIPYSGGKQLLLKSNHITFKSIFPNSILYKFNTIIYNPNDSKDAWLFYIDMHQIISGVFSNYAGSSNIHYYKLNTVE